MDKLLLFDTSIGSDNIGDQIIMDYCEQQLMDTRCSDFFIYKVPTHLEIGRSVYKFNKESKYSIVCGSNILKTTILINQLWKLSVRDIMALREICLLGVGWHNYTSFNVDLYTKWVYRTIFSKKLLLSVRDSYTEKNLRKIGIKNVLYTACPTMWNLTPEFCKEIPTKKADKVITALTFYKKNKFRDKDIIETLLTNYTKVFFFPQQAEDLDYLTELGYLKEVEVIKPSLAAFDEVLKTKNVDFVGTRLHAGIRALNYKCRSLIIAVDNRAAEIKKDTNLPVLLSNEINSLSNLVNSEIHLDIILPYDNIRKWKRQFI